MSNDGRVMVGILDIDGSDDISLREFEEFWNQAPPLRLNDGILARGCTYPFVHERGYLHLLVHVRKTRRIMHSYVSVRMCVSVFHVALDPWSAL